MTYNVFGGTLSLTQSINQPNPIMSEACIPAMWCPLEADLFLTEM